MASNLPFKADYAKSGRSKCHTTKKPIPAGTLRLGIMVASRHFDGMQPNWNHAADFMSSNRRKKPKSTAEIDGFDDLRPADQEQMEEWIKAYSKNAVDEDPATQRQKQDVRDQLSLVWQIRDLITNPTGAKDGKPLPPATIKSILEANHIPKEGATDELGKRLADAIVFGVPPVGNTAEGCCASRPLAFSSHTGRYVCQAPQAWGVCSYSQAVEDTVCQAIAIPAKMEKNKVAKQWLTAVQGVCGSDSLEPRARLYIPKDTSTVTKKTPAASSKLKKAPPPPPLQKGTAKPHLSRACVDPESRLAANHHVLDEAFLPGHNHSGAVVDFTEAFPVELYDTVLCQTDLATGTNSQYKLQILVPDGTAANNTAKVHLWRVWGRVGGQGGGGTKLEAYDTVDEAKAEFEKLYKKYTGNKWEDRKIFVKHPGKLFQLDVSYAENKDNSTTGAGGSQKAKAKVLAGDPNSKLDLRVQTVVAAMFDEGIAKDQLESLKVDLTKMPLAKITEAQLKDAYSALTEIEQVLQEPQNSSNDAMLAGKLQQLSNQFYSKCPSTNPVLIDSMKLLKTQVEMVDELINLMASNSVMKEEDTGTGTALVDEAYRKLKTELTPLDPAGEHYAMLKQYVENTRNATLPGVRGLGFNNWESQGLRLVDAFEVQREGEANRFQPSKSLGNRRLLWHGSRISNYSGILSQGLRIAPPEAPVSGYRFGKGIYCADMLGKSANYCRTNGTAEMYVMACDVSLGKAFETPNDMYMEKPQQGSHSTHALSDIIPDPAMAMQLSDHDHKVFPCSNGMNGKAGTDTVLIPLGTPTKNTNLPQSPSCDVSEFIVYNQAQVQIRYLLRLTTNPNTKAIDGAVGGATAVPRTTGTRIVINASRLRSNPGATALSMAGKAAAARLNSSDDDDSDDSILSAAGKVAAASAKRSSDDDDSDDSVGAAPPNKRQKRSVASFIRLDKEDRSRPSRSGLKVLNSRTFVEGLRLTVVRGDITEATTAAIVLPSDGALSLQGMVGSKVKEKAGPAFVTEVNALLSVPSAAAASSNPPSASTAAPVSQLPSSIRRLDTTTAGKTIRELATAANVPYLTPFYKVVKKEDVSATKDIICLDANGVYHRGQAARTVLGMAAGTKTSIAPAQIPVGAEVFVQSTSHNRKIPNNSAVLLETSAAPPPVTAAPSQPPGLQQQKKTLKTSEACAVTGHNLPASYVVFVVSPILNQQPSPTAAQEALKLAVKNALRECSTLQLETVTLPSIGSGRAGYDKAQAAAWIIDAIAEYLEEAGTSSTMRQSLQEVCFCLFDDESLEAYRLGILAHEKGKN